MAQRYREHDRDYAWLDDPDRRVTRWIAWQLLHFAEWLLLLAYGWRRTTHSADTEAAWLPPLPHPKSFEMYGRSHAINSMRYYTGKALTPRRGRRQRRLDDEAY